MHISLNQDKARTSGIKGFRSRRRAHKIGQKLCGIEILGVHDDHGNPNRPSDWDYDVKYLLCGCEAVLSASGLHKRIKIGKVQPCRKHLLELQAEEIVAFRKAAEKQLESKEAMTVEQAFLQMNKGIRKR